MLSIQLAQQHMLSVVRMEVVEAVAHHLLLQEVRYSITVPTHNRSIQPTHHVTEQVEIRGSETGGIES